MPRNAMDANDPEWAGPRPLDPGDLFTPFPATRRGDPETSFAAAEAASPALRASLAAVLTCFTRPMTDEQMIAAYQGGDFRPLQSVSGLRSRRAELVRQGRLKWTGGWLATRAGNKSRVWEVA